MKKIGYFLIVFLFLSCKGEKGLVISTDEIDRYVADKSGESQLYDVTQSLRFSKANETYEVVEYLQNDTVILYIETHVTEEEQVIRQTFFKNGVPIYVDEYFASNLVENPFSQRKIYLDGVNAIRSFSKTAEYEDDLEFIEFADASILIDEFDFDRPKNAMLQQGDYEMKFEEFIIIDPQTYLILENSTSNYDVALFVTEAHPLLDELYANQAGNKGRTIFVTHQFVLMSGIERMLFMDGYFVEDPEIEEDVN